MAIQKSKNNTRVNDQISAPELRVVGSDGEQIGILPTEDALTRAVEKDLDLVVVAPDADPPVAKIMDYGKFRYDQQKRQRENRKKQHTIAVKEVRMRPSIGDHDLETKMNMVIKFLKDGSRLKVSLRFRGREMSRVDLGIKLMDRVTAILAEHAVVDKAPNLEGRIMTMYFVPK